MSVQKWMNVSSCTCFQKRPLSDYRGPGPAYGPIQMGHRGQTDDHHTKDLLQTQVNVRGLLQCKHSPPGTAFHCHNSSSQNSTQGSQQIHLLRHTQGPLQTCSDVHTAAWIKYESAHMHTFTRHTEAQHTYTETHTHMHAHKWSKSGGKGPADPKLQALYSNLWMRDIEADPVS